MNLVIILKQVKRASLTCCFSFTGETALPQIWKQKMQIHYLREEDYPYIKHKIRLSLLNANIVI